jgi:hypothetical protein
MTWKGVRIRGYPRGRPLLKAATVIGGLVSCIFATWMLFEYSKSLIDVFLWLLSICIISGITVEVLWRVEWGEFR